MAQQSMPSWLRDTTQFWSAWGLRIAVLFSIGAHVALVLLARTRRQHVSVWGLLLWPAYMIATDLSATSALGKLSLDDTATSCQHQLVAFWAPFLLLHLGFPDNISAYALEDNTLSWRQGIEVPQRILGALYVLYKYIYLGNGGDLRPASAIMFAVGAFKYLERVVALWRGDLGNIRGSGKKEQGSRERPVVGQKLNNEEALLFAHDLFHLCKHAMVDDSSEEDEKSLASIKRLFSLEWRGMCKVLEMELSLMYDILYTKAAVIHTWGGYLIRLLSPPATAAAAVLFLLFPKGCLKPADIIITYILLAVAVLLDVVWLARALGSTWTYAFLNGRLGTSLHHALLCRGWRRLRSIVVSLDPSYWLLGRDPRSYRKWSGKIGRYNLLDECTRARGRTAGLRYWLLAKIGLEDSRYLFPLPLQVKELLFQRILQRLPMPGSRRTRKPEDPYTMLDITKHWGQEAVNRRPNVFPKGDTPCFGREFQEDILVWHIGTSIFLARAEQLIREGDSGKYAKAIEALSEYLMFLVAQRPHMLPGLVLRSLFKVTRKALDTEWIPNSSSSGSSKDKLAYILFEKKCKDRDWGRRDGQGEVNIRLMTDGAELAIFLFEKVTGKSENGK